MPASPHVQLLVSVRNPQEAKAAIAGGADIIDIKDPAAGSLGMADAAVIAAITETVNEQRPVSAAGGELADDQSLPMHRGLGFIKLGLARAPADWRKRLATRLATVSPHRFVAAAYADYQRVDAPSVDAVLNWAIEHKVAGLLVDTAIKDGRGLRHWCQAAQLTQWAQRVKQAGLFFAAAGSLTIDDVQPCVEAGATIIAVRGAACVGQNRTASVDEHRVREIKRAIAASTVGEPDRAG